jgi:SAM-dependent methyltransferase
MEWYDFHNIAERGMTIINPTTPEKLIRAGEVMGLHPGARVIDFGCGFGETLALWAERFGIGGVGVEVRDYAAGRARARTNGLNIEIACENAYAYAENIPPGSFDFAACLGATFIWGYFGEAVRAMRDVVRAGSKLAVGESFWRESRVEPDFSRYFGEFRTEYEIWQAARAEGYDVEAVIRASVDDWTRYECDNWRGYVRWLDENDENGDHAERCTVIERLHEEQDDYVRFGRAHLAWAIYILTPITYETLGQSPQGG